MKKSFTLIELLIVIMVISVLIGIALPRFRGMQEEANITRAKGELRTLQAAVESYYIHNNNTYPGALSLLVSATPNIIGSELPKDPFNGVKDYGYSTEGATPAKYYVIYSIGQDGNGSATVGTTGTVAESNGLSCIYVTNGNPRDKQP